MLRHYVYRLDHDEGFAPHIWRGVCTLCGCKKTTIERWATEGSWVVGIGGNGTGQPNKLIYAMEVDETPTYAEFVKQHPANAEYLASSGIGQKARVLIARKRFYYFGTKARTIPDGLAHIIHPVQGCLRLTDDDIVALKSLVLRRWKPGKHGEPNNGSPQSDC